LEEDKGEKAFCGIEERKKKPEKEKEERPTRRGDYVKENTLV